MKPIIAPLSSEEKKILSCSKKRWRVGEQRYDIFFTVLNKYIDHYQSCSFIDLSHISFPSITFNYDLLKGTSVYINDSKFYGITTFKDLEFKEKVFINGCEFLDKCCFENILFHQDISIMFNIFEGAVELKTLTFREEGFFGDNIFNKTVLIDTFMIGSGVIFTNSKIGKKCVIKNINNLRLFEWDELYCVHLNLCEWDQLNDYIALKEPSDIRLIHLVAEIQQMYPEVNDHLKTELFEYSSGWSCFFWLGRFGYYTRDLLGQREFKQAQKYLIFMDQVLKSDDQDWINTIETSFVENILYDLTHKQQKEAIQYVPARIKVSYENIWGAIS